MCLGVPGRVVEVFATDDVMMGKVDFGGVSRQVCLEHVRDVTPGDYVLVHVGFALARIDVEEAHRIYALLRELDQLDETREPEP